MKTGEWNWQQEEKKHNWGEIQSDIFQGDTNFINREERLTT